MPRYDAYVICTSPRSGSTLLCDLLAATGIAGDPDSYFHGPSIADWRVFLGLDASADGTASEREALAAIFQAAIARGRASSEIFGLRLQRHSFDFFTERLAVLHPGHGSDARRFHAAFGRTCFLHLTRRDKVEQAVSHLKAEQSGLWHRAPDGSELERLSPPRALAYDGDAIRAQWERMKAYDRDWARWFDAEGIAPLEIAYETLSAQPIETLRQVLDHLGLGAAAADGVQPGVAKLADATSRDWVARFYAEIGGSRSQGDFAGGD